MMATASRTMSRLDWSESDDSSDVPPLESGDRLSRDEFERRYHAMPPHVRAELVEGVVYVASPVSSRHGHFHFDLNTWLGLYRVFTPGVEGASDATVRLDLDNVPQPDLLLKIRPDHGGRSRVSEDGYIEGPPEFVVEVAASSASYDLHDKLNAYRRNEVLEYVVWRVRDQSVDWFVLRNGRYERLAPSADGLLRSEVFPGLWLDAAALLRGDMASVFRHAQEGTTSPDHAAFVARLQESAERIKAATLVPPQPPEGQRP